MPVRSAPDESPRWPVHWMIGPLLLLLIVLRLPAHFCYPQFWAEDGSVLFIQARTQGWHSLLMPYPAYFVVAQRLVAYLLVGLPALYAPTAYLLASVSYALLTA